MSIAAMTGAVGWKIQSGYLSGTSPTPPTGEFYWHKAREVSIAPVQIDQVFDPEVGGGMLPAGAYKGGMWSAGDMDLIPRVDDNLGWLLLAFAGADAVSGAGPYHHRFPGTADSSQPQKYLCVRRQVPVGAGQPAFGETFFNCKVTRLTMTANPGSVLGMRASVQGGWAISTDTASGTGWTPTYEGFTGAPIATKGYFELPDGTALTNVQQVSIDMVNGTPQPQQEMVLGQYFPHDVTVLSRSITVNAVFFWQNASLYKSIYYGGSAGGWSAASWTGGSPFECAFETPGNLDSVAYPGKIGFRLASNGVNWRCDPVGLRGGDVVVMRITGTALDVSSGEDWTLWLENKHSGAYT